MTEVSQFSEAEWDVWRTFTTMRRQLDHALEKQLQRDAGISRPDFEILLAVFDAPQRQLRSGELAEILGWEKSRVSHQTTRMARRGLLTRRDCDADGRGTWVGLTADGRRAVLGSMRDHAATIRRYFFDALTTEQLESLSASSHQVLDAIDPPVCRMDEARGPRAHSDDDTSADAVAEPHAAARREPALAAAAAAASSETSA
jgi:DNA-binding MarR family transcriptional regulator